MDNTEAKEGTAMNTITTPTREEIVAIDTRLAEINEARAQLAHDLDLAMNRMHRAAGDRRVPNPTDKYGPDVWEMTNETVIAATAAISPATYAGYIKIKESLRALRTERDELTAVYAEHRWSRFFLVTNEDGHIHSNTCCSSCRPTTQFAWLPQLSGQTEADAVEAHGAILCTFCYPTAPVEYTNGESHAKRAKRDEIEARKAERLAKKLEKALLPNAEPLVLAGNEYVNGRGMAATYTYTIETLAQAQTWLREICDLRAEVRHGFWSNGQTTDEIITRMRGGRECWTHENEAMVIEAIAAKTGTTPEAVAAEAAMKAEKKAKRLAR